MIVSQAMAATVLLKDIVDAMDIQFDESLSFLDLDTGKVESVSRDLLSLSMAEELEEDEEPDLPEWQYSEWEVARRIVSTDRYKRLPTKFDIHEWAIMQDFSYTVEPGSIREELLNAIHGRGAFRYFKDA